MLAYLLQGLRGNILLCGLSLYVHLADAVFGASGVSGSRVFDKT